MIFVTGAGGTVGSELVGQLRAGGARLRAGYFSQGKADAARARGIEAVAIDYRRADTLRAAFDGCTRLFLLAPNVPDQAQLELAAVEAARAAGVRQVVKLSVLDADGEAFAMARVHRPVERAIEASGMAWTFLRPNSFMQNIANYMGESIRTADAFHTACGQARIAHVDARDVAAVAAKALVDTAHEGRAYTPTGPAALDYDEVAATLSQALGRPIRHVGLAPAELGAGMRATGVPEEIVQRLLDLQRYFREGHAARTTDDVRRVTGREARPFAAYARECAGLLGAGGQPIL